ncbi:MAG: arginine--tRNA ligase [Gammaproteobacteria bacterium]|nr:arginine--tRNA ligase [Gammaproteobacteria bacterium]
MKQHLQQLLNEALDKLRKQESLDFTIDNSVKIEQPRDNRHGDFSSNCALVIATQINSNPRELADKIVNNIPKSELVEKTEVAGPGFINFFLNKHSYLEIINNILDAGEKYGCSDFGKGEPILIEFVSANPTGPLHIGHGRGAAYGAAVANLLEAIGYKVDREYYVNDAGRQMDILAISLWLRYLQLCGHEITLPVKAYQGEYIKSIAEKIYSDKGKSLQRDIPEQSILEYSDTTDEKQLDELIKYTKTALGEDNYRYIFDSGLNEILEEIRTDLQDFGITYSNWYSERSLLSGNQVNNCIKQLKENGYLYEKDGALWFCSSKYGDEKDRVVVRDSGQATYFASDIAYHKLKFERGYTRAIDIWGADHHGYIARIKAALSALGVDPEKLDILLVQFASLFRGKEKVQMSTRSGQFVTLKELREEVGKDATRYFYIMRKSEQHLDFDLELAKSQSNDNPVYYIQYAHARICSVLHQMHEKGFDFTPEAGNAEFSLLIEPQEQSLLANLAGYPDIVHAAAINYEPHHVAYYLRDLANEFHTYYNACQFLVESEQLRKARISLIFVVRQVIRNGLNLLGVSAPEKM